MAEPAALGVQGVAGPLRAGEVERATCWANTSPEPSRGGRARPYQSPHVLGGTR